MRCLAPETEQRCRNAASSQKTTDTRPRSRVALKAIKVINYFHESANPWSVVPLAMFQQYCALWSLVWLQERSWVVIGDNLVLLGRDALLGPGQNCEHF